MNCSHCKHPGADGRNYCGACGGQLAQYCRLCGFRNLVQDLYCGGCGGQLAKHAEEVAAARPAAGQPPATSSAMPGSSDVDGGALAELIAAARDSEKVEPDDGDIKVSQDDIDSLFGD